MELESFLADSVANAEGKLYVQGAGWNVIHTQVVPVRHDRIGIGVLIRVPYTATNETHTFSLSLEDADGRVLPLGDGPEQGEPLMELGAEFRVGRPPALEPGDSQIVPFAVNLNGLVFAEADAYSFVLKIDGEPYKRLSFRVALTQP